MEFTAPVAEFVTEGNGSPIEASVNVDSAFIEFDSKTTAVMAAYTNVTV